MTKIEGNKFFALFGGQIGISAGKMNEGYFIKIQGLKEAYTPGEEFEQSDSIGPECFLVFNSVDGINYFTQAIEQMKNQIEKHDKDLKGE